MASRQRPQRAALGLPRQGRAEGPPVAGDPWDIEEHDTPAEVDAAFRTQRRVAVGYFVLLVLAILAVPLLTAVLDWWSTGRLLGGMSPNFLVVAVGLYVFFFLLGLAAAMLGNTVEDRMLGGSSWQELTLDGDLDTEDRDP